MLDKKRMIEDIRLGLAVLQSYIRPGGPMNLTDINVHAEDFVGNLLNALNGWDLRNTNKEVSNFPCIDLFGETAKVGVQVTSEKGSAKINEALDCLRKHAMSSKVNKFYHFSLIPRQDNYTIHSVPDGISFNAKDGVLDFDSLQKMIQAANDTTVAELHRVVRDAMPTVFAAEVNRLAAMRSELHACQTIFDRELMRAPFNREDPVEMYKAIGEMRISLQKRGASRIPHEVVAQNFEKAKSVLSNCEGIVRSRYPYIHDAVKTSTTPNYQGNDYGDAINLMMSIRQVLMPLIEENDTVLKGIDKILSHT